jgi:hypothetical protein
MGVTAAAIIGGSALVGSGLSFMGSSNQAKSSRQAMERYLNALQGQRNLFLNQPETGAIRKKLGSYVNGDVGYDPELLSGMKAQTQEAYGNSLADMTRLIQKGGAGQSGVYTPGRADRTARLLGQNIASNRANSMRDINQKNADVALNNQRFAVSALPTYMPGTPATQVAGPDVYAAAGNVPHVGSFMGPAIQQAGNTWAQYKMYAPIMERMMQGGMGGMSGLPSAGNSPTMQSGYDMAGSPEMMQRLFPRS